jgi:hypothetical protein
LPGDTLQNGGLHLRLTPTGSEHSSDSTRKQSNPETGGALSGALGGENASELAEVVSAWQALSADVRAKILAMVRARK